MDYDNDPMPLLLDITLIHYLIDELAGTLFEPLLGEINQASLPHRQVIFDPELKIRKTLGRDR